MPPEMAFAAHPPQLLTLQVPSLPSDWRAVAIKFTTIGDPMKRNKVYDRKDNPLLPAALAHNVQVATDYVQQLRKTAEEQHGDMPRLLREIEQELTRYE